MSEGDVDLARRHDRRGRARRGRARRRRAARRVRHDPRVGRRHPQGQARRAGQRRQRPRRRPTPASFGAEGIGLCRTEHMFLGEDRLPIVRRDDPGRHARRGGRPRSRSCAWRRRPTSWRSSRRWTGCRSPCACSTRRCTSSCPAIEELEVKEATTGASDDRGAEAAGRGPARGTSSTRCSAPAACASASSSPGSTPCRCGRSWRRPPSGCAAGGKPDRRDHDPAHRHPRGDGLARGVGRGGDRRGHQGRQEEARRSRSAR